MSKLLITDHGRSLKDHNEDLTRWRMARKVLRLPQTAAAAGADLWILASAYSQSSRPLPVLINNHVAGNLTPQPGGGSFRWHRLPVPAKLLRPGDNQIVFACDSPAMNAWRLALDNTTGPGRSHISFDRGVTWRNDRMGVHNVLAGEYVVRLRSHAPTLRDPVPPEVVYPDPQHPRLRELRALAPKAIAAQRDPWKQLLALRTWVATRWSHDPTGRNYCPWDAPTILDWTRQNRGHDGKGKTAMCVHFAVTFASIAAALGHRVRCLAVTVAINAMAGHFVAEVYDVTRGKWILHDPNYDVHYEDGQALSAVELAQRVHAGMKRIARLTRIGPGMPTHPARVTQAFRRHFASGASYRLISVWQRMDFITDPAWAAAHHGSTVYHEPDWVWFAPAAIDRDAELGMFPRRVADPAWFQRSPAPR